MKNYQALRIITDNFSKELVMKYAKNDNANSIWESLKLKFDEIRYQAPMAIHDWENLFVTDYKSIQEYDNALSEITMRLTNCGESYMVAEKAMVRKTIETLPRHCIDLKDRLIENDYTSY
jgi:hypothetical protein